MASDKRLCSDSPEPYRLQEKIVLSETIIRGQVMTVRSHLSLDSYTTPGYIWGCDIGVWRSLAARMLWEHDVGGSNPLTPIFYNSPRFPGYF